MTEQPLIPRLPEESGRWYSRLIEFIAQPPGNRSILEVYRLEGARKGASSIPGSWRVAVDRFQWRERAQAFDDHQAREEMNRFADLRRAESEKRFQLLKRGRIALGKVLKNLITPARVQTASWGDFLRGLSIFAAADREERQPFGGSSLEIETPDGYIARIRTAMSTGSMPGFGAGLPEEMQREETEIEDDAGMIGGTDERQD